MKRLGRQTRRVAACCVMGLVGLSGLAGPACTFAQPVSVQDDAGQTVTLNSPAQRVIALAPHLTEIAFALGGGAQVVGVMRYSDFPPEAASRPVVGDALALDYERIVALKPDLVLVWRSGLNPRHRDRLRALGLPVYESESGSVDAITATLRRVGRLMGHGAAAEQAALVMERRWRGLQDRHAGAAPVRVFYQLWHEPLMTVNRRHLIDQAIRACGGVNPFADLPALTPTIGWEAAVQADPQVVITGRSPDEPPRLERWRDFPQVEAVRHDRLLVLDGPALARMSPRFVDAADRLCELIDRARH